MGFHTYQGGLWLPLSGGTGVEPGDPPVATARKLAIIGGTQLFQTGNGRSRIVPLLVERGWRDENSQLYYYAAQSKPLIDPDNTSQAGTLTQIAQAKAQLGGVSDWFIDLGAADVGGTDAETTSKMTQILNALASGLPSNGKVSFMGLSQSGSLPAADLANRARFERIARTMVDFKSRQFEWFDWHRYNRGFSQTGLWASDNTSMTNAGYDLRNSFIAESIGYPPGLEPIDTRLEGPRAVRYEDLYAPGDDLQAVVNKVTGGRILTFPDGEFLFGDFKYGDTYSALDFGRDVPSANTKGTGCIGIWGNRETVFRQPNGISTKASATGVTTNPLHLIHAWGATGGVMKNFSIIGGDQGHDFNGIRFSQSLAPTVENVYVEGVQGSMNYPPGETFGINFWRSQYAALLHSEVDGRRGGAGGPRIGASPFGWNSTTDAYVRDVYTHHGKTGMGTWWQTRNIHTVDYRNDYMATGRSFLSGSIINHENVGGVIRHVRMRGIIDRESGNTGLHIGVNNSSKYGYPDATDIQILEPTFDPGPTGGCFSMMIGDSYDGNTQTQKSYPYIVYKGVVLQGRDTNNGTAAPNPLTQFFRYH